MKRVLAVLLVLVAVHSASAQLTTIPTRGTNLLSAISTASAEGGTNPACGEGQANCSSTLGSVSSQILYYNFSECAASGNTTITDWSGNGNGLTLSGTSAPTCTAQGLLFPATPQQYVQLPSAVAAGKTFSYVLCAVPNNGFGTSGAGSTAQLLSSDNTGGIALSLGVYGPPYNTTTWIPMMGYANGTFTWLQYVVSANTYGGGCHNFTFVYDGTTLANNHIYVDGTETPYARQNQPPGNIALGNLYIGKPAPSCPSCGLWGYLRSMRVYSTRLTAAQIQTIATLDASVDTNLGMPQWKPNSSPVEQITIQGDSRTKDSGTGTLGQIVTWPNKLTTGTTFNLNNNSQDGRLLHTIRYFDPYNALAEYSTAAPRNTLYIWACVNDAVFGGSSAAQCEADLAGTAAADKANGYKVIVFEEASGGAYASTTFDVVKDTLNAWVRSNWTNFADGVVTCTDPKYCADGAYANSTYFWDSFVHPTAVTQNLIATYASNAYLMLYGSTATSPHSTSASSYQMTAADSYLNVNNTSNAVALTLPNCLGFRSSVWSITAGSGSYAVTIAPTSGQTIDGSSSAITVSAGQTKTLTLTPGAVSTGGCSWI